MEFVYRGAHVSTRFHHCWPCATAVGQELANTNRWQWFASHCNVCLLGSVANYAWGAHFTNRKRVGHTVVVVVALVIVVVVVPATAVVLVIAVVVVVVSGSSGSSGSGSRRGSCSRRAW